MTEKAPTAEANEAQLLEARAIFRTAHDAHLREAPGGKNLTLCELEAVAAAIATRDAEIERLNSLIEFYRTGWKTELIRIGRRQMREEAAQIVEQVAKDDDTSALGEAAADAFNSGNARRSMDLRLQDWNTVIADGIRALPDDPPTQEPPR